MPPGNANAALAKRRREKLTGLPEDKAGSGFAQGCTHGIPRVALMPQGHKHYAMETCAVCGRFLRWLPKPETVQRQRLNAFRLARLAMHLGLTDWERQFIRSVGEKKHISPAANPPIRLCATYLESKHHKRTIISIGKDAT
jgi:hypothetical protein